MEPGIRASKDLKFGTIMDQFISILADEGMADEELSSPAEGYYALFNTQTGGQLAVDPNTRTADAGRFGDRPELNEDEIAFLDRQVGAILHSPPTGIATVAYFQDFKDLDASWDDIEVQISEENFPKDAPPVKVQAGLSELEDLIPGPQNSFPGAGNDNYPVKNLGPDDGVLDNPKGLAMVKQSEP